VAALVFSVHPLRVESVAWATERRDVLSVAFLIPCVLCYVRYGAGPARRWRWYGASVVLLLLSLLSKAWGMTLPAVLLVLDVYPLRRIRLTREDLFSPAVVRILVDKLPFVVLAGWIAIKAGNAQATTLYTMKTLAEHDVANRVAQAFYGLAFYAGKTIVPVGLAPLYEIPFTMRPFEPRFVVAAVVVIAGIAALAAGRRRWPAGSALLAVYVITLAPVLGIAQSGPQLVADRYSYVSCMPLALLAGAAMLAGRQRLACRWAPPGAIGLCIAVAIAWIGTLGALTWRQTHVWRTSQSLWERALAVDPTSRYAHYNLGVHYANGQQYEHAIEQFHATLRLDPAHTGALSSLGRALQQQGKPVAAIERYTEALAIQPAMPKVHRWLASCLQEIGRHDEAVSHWKQALQLEPGSMEARSQLGIALVKQGNIDAALPHLIAAVEADPNDSDVRYNLGLALARADRIDPAIPHFEACLRLAPDHYDARYCLAAALAAQNRADRAVEEYRAALQLRPDAADAHGGLADVLARQGQAQGAIVHYRAVLRAAPDQLHVANKLAWLLATSPDPAIRDGAEALRLARHACRGTDFAEPRFLNTLAAACAATGRYEEAIQTLDRIIPWAATQDPALHDEIRQRRRQYEAARRQ
jgi:tetratricopeptide (TPR) repeat protein